MRTLVILFVISSTHCFAQEKPAPTSEEEYNYMTKGYRVQTESGLDMKKGYLLTNSETVVIGNYSFDVKILIRETKNELAGVLIVTKSKISGNTYYVAIPLENEELMSRYYAVLDDFDSSLLTAYSYLVSAYLGSALTTAHEVTKGK